MSSNAPIVIFTYDRPKHLSLVLRGLSESKSARNSPLFVFCDGPKVDATVEQLMRIDEVRNVVNAVPWENKVVVRRNENLGLARSIIYGINQVLETYDEVIVLEDDIVPKNGFIDYCKEALDLYRDDEKVFQIAGSVYDADLSNIKESTFFARCLQCHGWATWKRAWKHFEEDLLHHITNIFGDTRKRREFDCGSEINFFSEQLARNFDGRLNTWAVIWYSSWFLQNGLCLFPASSLVENIGFDSNGTNTNSLKVKSYLKSPISTVTPTRIPIEVNYEGQKAINSFWSEYGREGVSQFEIRKLKRFLSRFYRKSLITILPAKKLSNKPLCNENKRLKYCKISDKARLHGNQNLTFVRLGDYSYISVNAVVSYTVIGNFCSIGPDFKSGWGIHPLNKVSTSPSFYSSNPPNDLSIHYDNLFIERKPILIGNDVFIGRGVTVLDGVTIGDGAVIGAGCVVSKNVEPYTVVAGNPMKVLRKRFSDEKIELLRQSMWWNLEPEDIKNLNFEEMSHEGSRG